MQQYPIVMNGAVPGEEKVFLGQKNCLKSKTKMLEALFNRNISIFRLNKVHNNSNQG